VGPTDEAERLRQQARRDRKLLQRAADALAEIHRGPGLSDAHADVLAALRIRLEGKSRASLDEVLRAAGDIDKRDLGDALGSAEGGSSREWPTIEERKRDWPGA
jgi:hypothetical protein